MAMVQLYSEFWITFLEYDDYKITHFSSIIMLIYILMTIYLSFNYIRIQE